MPDRSSDVGAKPNRQLFAYHFKDFHIERSKVLGISDRFDAHDPVTLEAQSQQDAKLTTQNDGNCGCSIGQRQFPGPGAGLEGRRHRRGAASLACDPSLNVAGRQPAGVRKG